MFLSTIVNLVQVTVGDGVKSIWILQPISLPSLTTTIFLGLGIIAWYYLFWKPYDLHRDLTELGFDDVNHSKLKHLSTDSARRDAINGLLRKRKIGELPPAYPNGWFVILETDQLKKGQAKEVNVLGLNLVAWRGDSGKSYVADAYCPHLGAHLGVGGKVEGECVRCPFHGWTFKGGDGRLANIPYSKNIPEFAKIKMWETIEGNGFIYLWFHAEGDEPSWKPHIYPEISSGSWKYRGRTELHVACHIQEIPENGADMSHLNIVHDQALMCGGEPERSLLRWDFLKHVWTNGSWRVSEVKGEKHVAIMELRHEMFIWKKIPLMQVDVVTKQVGPGTVILEMETSIGRGVLFHMVTPLEPMRQRVTHRFYSSNALIHPYGKLILLAEAIMIERDVRIWNRKAFIKNPLLTAEDRMIKQFRQWYSQFYSENSQRQYFVKSENGNPLAF